MYQNEMEDEEMRRQRQTEKQNEKGRGNKNAMQSSYTTRILYKVGGYSGIEQQHELWTKEET